jgi:hypothetical protein
MHGGGDGQGDGASERNAADARLWFFLGAGWEGEVMPD